MRLTQYLDIAQPGYHGVLAEVVLRQIAQDGFGNLFRTNGFELKIRTEHVVVSLAVRADALRRSIAATRRGGSMARQASKRKTTTWALAILSSGRDCCAGCPAPAASARSSAFSPLGHLGISTCFLGIGFFCVRFRLIPEAI